jgi:hypothetical protein
MRHTNVQSLADEGAFPGIQGLDDRVKSAVQLELAEFNVSNALFEIVLEYLNGAASGEQLVETKSVLYSIFGQREQD